MNTTPLAFDVTAAAASLLTAHSAHVSLATASLSMITAYVAARAFGSEHPSYHVALFALFSYLRGQTALMNALACTVMITAVQSLLSKSTLRTAEQSSHRQTESMLNTRFASTFSEGQSHNSCNTISLRPLLFPSRTTHRRLFPSQHSFTYSYLFVGIPIKPISATSIPLLSTHSAPTSSTSPDKSPSTFSIHSETYLQRGSPYTSWTFQQKLDSFLTSQGVDPNKYPHAYLVTAPQFLGFSFNPVSFWYLYTADQQLGGMIMEVNNTFDERRIYLLDREERDAATTTTTTTIKDNDSRSGGETTKGAAKGKRFKFSWRKDFHVSPFSDRDGTYSVSAVDVARTGVVDVTLVLADERGKAKVVGRAYSTMSETRGVERYEQKTDEAARQQLLVRSWLREDPIAQSDDGQRDQDSRRRRRREKRKGAETKVGQGIDPYSLSMWQQILFVLRYGYIGLLTNSRVLYQAWFLWRKKLTVYFRPEPLQGAIGRTETAEENAIERAFKIVLDHLGRDAGVTIEYTSAAGMHRGEKQYIGDVKEQSDSESKRPLKDSATVKADLKVEVLAPTFYTELARANGDVLDVFDRYCFRARDKEALLYASDHDNITSILRDHPVVGKAHGSSATKTTTENLVALARTLGRSGWQKTMQRIWTSTSVTWAGQLSAFDLLTKHRGSEGPGSEVDYGDYLRVVSLVLLADKVALGSTFLLRIQVRVARVVAVSLLTGWATHAVLSMLGTKAIDQHAVLY